MINWYLKCPCFSFKVKELIYTPFLIYKTRSPDFNYYSFLHSRLAFCIKWVSREMNLWSNFRNLIEIDV